MLNTMPGYEVHVIKQVSRISGVTSVEGVFGIFDVVVKVESPNAMVLSKIVSNIRKTEGIKSTLTMSTIEAQHKKSAASNIDYLARG